MAERRLQGRRLERVLGRQRAVLDRLRQRRLVDLLRARPGRVLRARPDAGRLHHHRRDLLPARPPPTPRRPRCTRRPAARSSFARRAFNEFWSFFAAWGQMLNYIITVAISAFFVPHYLGGCSGRAAALARRHHRRHRRDRRAGGDQHRRRQGVGRRSTSCWRSSTSCTQLLLVLVGAVLVFSPQTLVDNVHLGIAPTWTDFLLAIPVGMIAYTGIETISNMAEEAKDEAQDDPARDQAACVIAVFAIYALLPAVALSALPVTQTPTASTRRCSACPRSRAATPATRCSAWSSRSTSAPLQHAAEIYVGLLAATILFIATNAGHHRRLAARLLDGHPPPGARPAAPAAPEVPHAVDRDHRVRRDRAA